MGLLYQYDDEEEVEIMRNTNNEKKGSPIFSRVHSPPPRHRNVENEFMEKLNENEKEKEKEKENEENENEEEAEYDYDDEEDDEVLNDEMLTEQNVLNVNVRHYYNARYPPRRGRYGRN